MALETTDSKPVILMVQGSIMLPSVYKQLEDHLNSIGYSTVHPVLPSCDERLGDEVPLKSLIDDALAIRLELIRQIEYEGKKVVMVMHSYGGIVGTEALREEYSFSHREKQGLAGGVIHQFCFSAFMLQAGQSVLSTFGESPNNLLKVSLSVTISRY